MAGAIRGFLVDRAHCMCGGGRVEPDDQCLCGLGEGGECRGKVVGRTRFGGFTAGGDREHGGIDGAPWAVSGASTPKLVTVRARPDVPVPGVRTRADLAAFARGLPLVERYRAHWYWLRSRTVRGRRFGVYAHCGCVVVDITHPAPQTALLLSVAGRPESSSEERFHIAHRAHMGCRV